MSPGSHSDMSISDVEVERNESAFNNLVLVDDSELVDNVVPGKLTVSEPVAISANVDYPASPPTMSDGDLFPDWFGVKEEQSFVGDPICEVFPGGVPDVRFRGSSSPVNLPAFPLGTPGVVGDLISNDRSLLPESKVKDIPPVVPATKFAYRPIVGPHIKSSKIDLAGIHGVSFGEKVSISQLVESGLSKEDLFFCWFRSPKSA